jgi:hypothetical protein
VGFHRTSIPMIALHRRFSAADMGAASSMVLVLPGGARSNQSFTGSQKLAALRPIAQRSIAGDDAELPANRTHDANTLQSEM